jgi:RimJ/RimL family protein N-acetyltransferase
MLKGKYIGLRSIEKSDLPQLLEWRNKPEYRRYFREYREINAESQNRWFESKVLNDASTRMFAIEDLSNKNLLGACGLCYIDWINRNADFSIYIGAQDLYVDDKFAIDASLIMIKYGFEELNLHRLWAEIYDIDKPKQKMFDQLGFKLDGIHRQTHWMEGKWCNSLFYSFLENEYKSNE